MTDNIRLDKFLKWTDMAESGGNAKYLIQKGFIRVNNVIEKRRGIRLVRGDLVEINEPSKPAVRLKIT